jgi:hypothetical protein
MSTVIFAAGNRSYNISQVVYAGPVLPIPEDLSKSECTHSFKLITACGASYCYFKSEEAATNARRALGAMLLAKKPYLFKRGSELLDPRAVVSFSHVIELKKPIDDSTHAFVISLRTADTDHGKAWMRFTSEEDARKAMRGLYASLHAAYHTPAIAASEHAMEPATAAG